MIILNRPFRSIEEERLTSLTVSQPGGCLCGALRFEARAQPVRLTLCYCSFCQRATGSTHMVEPIFLRSDFAIVTGTPKIYSLISSGSGKRVDVSFCGVCGTKVCLTFERFPELVGVYGGTFDDPSWFDRSREITACLFLDSAQVGALIPAGVKVFGEHRTKSDGTPNEPLVFDTPFEVKRRE